MYNEKRSAGLSIAGFVVSLVALLALNLYGITGLVGAILSGTGFRKCLHNNTKGVVFGAIGWGIGFCCFLVGMQFW